VNIPIDVGDMSQPDEEARKEDIAVLKGWLDIAKEVGCPCARINTGKFEDPSSLKRIIISYKVLVEYAENLGIDLLLENHGGISNDPEKMIEIVRGVDSPHFGTCPDIGNFPENIRYEGLEKSALYALLVYAKMREFDSRGQETTIDMERCVNILKKTGYDGYLSIEFEGSGDEFEGVKKSKQLLKRYL